MKFDLDIFVDALISPTFIQGALLTVGLAACAQATGILLGLVAGFWRAGSSASLRVLAGLYVWVFRALPALLILILVWNALPQVAPVFKEDWFTPFLAGFLGLAVLEGALMAEIFRSALLAIDPGQRLAARALGFNPTSVTVKVIIPQMIRVAIPPTGNQFINMLKLTSLASVISLQELLTAAQHQVSSTFRYAEYYGAAAVYYLVIVSVFMLLQGRLEKRYEWNSQPGRRRLDLLPSGWLPAKREPAE